MSALRALLAGTAPAVHLRIVRAQGSAPRGAGAEMVVTATAQAGTIGGGQAEHRAVQRARAMLAAGERAATLDLPLGPEIGQCCGGRIMVELAWLDAAARAALLARLDATHDPQVIILGAGHVGRALAGVLALMPCTPVLVDPRAEQIAQAPPGVAMRLTPLPEAEIAAAPPASAFVVVTHDHGLDFVLALAALQRGDAAYVGLIGSATKRARFARFAHADGTDPGALVCPIGRAGLGDKRPEVIALATAQEVMAALPVPVAAEAAQA